MGDTRKEINKEIRLRKFLIKGLEKDIHSINHDALRLQAMEYNWAQMTPEDQFHDTMISPQSMPASRQVQANNEIRKNGLIEIKDEHVQHLMRLEKMLRDFS